MNFIKEISYGTLSGGSKNGLVMFEIVFNGEEPNSNDLTEIARIIEMVTNHPGANCRAIHYRGQYPIAKSEIMFSMLAGFHSSGFRNLVTLDGLHYYQWLSAKGTQGEPLVTGAIIHLQSPVWIKFPFTELIMDIGDSSIVEPSMPAQYDGRQMLFLNPVADFARDTAAVFKYIQKAKLNWNINVNAKVSKEYLFKQEES